MLLLMFCGGCTGSTAGGIKTSRVAILVKNAFNELRRFAHPKYVRSLKLDRKSCFGACRSFGHGLFFGYNRNNYRFHNTCFGKRF